MLPDVTQAPVDPAILDEIAARVLWLATRIVDAANRRPNIDGVKVGGHQASSASLVTAMTALWFGHLNAEDRVSVKPHASPVLHAINYLLGNLDSEYLTELRSFGGLQAYPSRTKDPGVVDFSTGSVGLGAAAPLFAAATRRYVDAHFGPRPRSRFIALMGDAELDEGNVWEAIADPATHGLGNVMWVVDFNRQSLDRVVPGIRIRQWRAQFEAAGWHVIEVKYGPRLRTAFAGPRGQDLALWIDAMPNERYQQLFQTDVTAARAVFLEGAPDSVQALCSTLDDVEFRRMVTDLGGHDMESMLNAYRKCDEVTDRPSVIFAYTVKGWGLPFAGNPRNHSMLLDEMQLAELRRKSGLDLVSEWSRLNPNTPAGSWVQRRATELCRPLLEEQPSIPVPASSGARFAEKLSTQEAFGKVMVGLSRAPELADVLVTTAPDVATSTNLAGFINRTGVFHPEEQVQWGQPGLVKWVEGPAGHHIELGISEMNLFLLLGQLGLAEVMSGQRLIPVGTLYDPFVLRGLDAFVYSIYSGSRFLVAGTPSGITLAPEGGAHQSTVTASLGIELPGVILVEPAYAQALDWLVCAAVEQLGKPPQSQTPDGRGAFYFRLSTRPIDQMPFEAAKERLGDAVLRRQVLAGAYRLIEAPAAGAPRVQIAASGPVIAEAIDAAIKLREEGVATDVVDVTSINRLHSAWQRSVQAGVRTASVPALPGVMRAAFVPGVPLVTVHDASSHAMSWLGSALGVVTLSLGVDDFGQSGTIGDLYRAYSLDSDSVTNAAMAALALATQS